MRIPNIVNLRESVSSADAHQYPCFIFGSESVQLTFEKRSATNSQFTTFHQALR